MDTEVHEEISSANNEIDGQKPQKKALKHDSGAADLEKVTDYAEEKEISPDILRDAMALIGDRRTKESAEKLARDKELAKVVIRKEDVELMMNELEIPRSVAEVKLKEHSGNLVAALVSLTD